MPAIAKRFCNTTVANPMLAPASEWYSITVPGDPFPGVATFLTPAPGFTQPQVGEDSEGYCVPALWPADIANLQAFQESQIPQAQSGQALISEPTTADIANSILEENALAACGLDSSATAAQKAACAGTAEFKAAMAATTPKQVTEAVTQAQALSQVVPIPPSAQISPHPIPLRNLILGAVALLVLARLL